MHKEHHLRISAQTLAWFTTLELARLDEVVGDGEARRTNARGNVEFGVDRSQMLADGPLANREEVGDFRIRQATRDEYQNFDLAFRQPPRRYGPRLSNADLQCVGLVQRQPGAEWDTDGPDLGEQVSRLG